MTKNILIVSAKYAPGLFKEFVFFGEKLEKLGCNISYILAQKYQDRFNERPDRKSQLSNYHYLFSSANGKEIIKDTIDYQFSLGREIDTIFADRSPDFVFVYNPHPLNYLILKQARAANPRCETAIYLHEPYKPDKYLYGVSGYIYFKIVDICQQISLKYANNIILPSAYAVELFKQRFPNFSGKTYLVPILVPDKKITQQERKFYTIAGLMNEGKGLDKFCELIEYIAAKKLDYQFRILTSSNIQPYLSTLSQAAKSITSIENPKSITDEEMFRAHAQSEAFFLLHTTATQSGAMIVAFMQGTPVIARNIPAFAQFITDRENSCLVPKDCTVEDLLAAMKYVRANNSQLSLNARKTYECSFSSQSWNHHYSWLLDILEIVSTEQ